MHKKAQNQQIFLFNSENRTNCVHNEAKSGKYAWEAVVLSTANALPMYIMMFSDAFLQL